MAGDDPYFGVPGLDVFIGQEMMSEAGEYLLNLETPTEEAELRFQLVEGAEPADGGSVVIDGGMPVSVLARPEVISDEHRRMFPASGTFGIDLWIDQASLPPGWTQLGLTRHQQWWGVGAAELASALVAASCMYWDGVLADFLAFHLFTEPCGSVDHRVTVTTRRRHCSPHCQPAT